ncbi:PP2C family protein-serine/threonine phosphatase [Cuspidothrix issatschenkoi]|uniref:PP2C family protein-serine/threonine phosphatase n=1 Tax=Cuspidothrix issatschenkoi TaxID=230752 RepID=UPI001A9C8E25|nr:SpoIIE family protein phosphatase [Cuspidothrix issatschenkoi]
MNENLVQDPITVLLIDDQPMIAEAVRRMLVSETDINFHYCNNPTQALKVARSCQPTIILQDLVMPEMEGLVLVRFLRAENSPTKDVPLIVLSSKEEPVIKAKAFALGANDYIVKLPDKLELIARIRYHSQAYVNLLKRKEAEAILQADNLRMRKELEMLRQMQRMILPTAEELSTIEDLEIAGYMEPADEVGGDYYDILYTDNLVTIAIGDVTGHGLESGILMVMTQTAVRTLKEIQELDPVKFLDVLNRTIYKNVQRMNSEKNLTLAILTYAEGKISISGQHEETIVVRKGGEIERINTINLGFPIGLEAEISDFIDHTILDLNEDDGIVLYSDGIPEAYSMDKKQYGLEKLCEVISQNWHESAEKIKQVIIDDVKRHIGEQKVFDDITLVVLKRKFRQNQEILETQSAILELELEPELEPEPEPEPELEPEPEPELEIPHNGGKRKKLGFFRRQSFL